MPTAEIFLYGVIGDYWGGVSALGFAQELRAAEAAGADEIVVRINSEGGAAIDGIAMYNALAATEVKTTAIVEGYAASAASLVMQGADDRVVRPGSFVMIHRPHGWAIGRAEDLRAEADVLDQLDGQYAGLYVDRTGVSRDEVVRQMDAETWFAHDAAVDAGFADRVEGPRAAAVALRAQAVVLDKYRNVPEVVKRMARGGSKPKAQVDEVPGIPDETPAEPKPADPIDPPAQPSDPVEDPKQPDEDPPADTPPTDDDGAVDDVTPAPDHAEQGLPAAYYREVLALCAKAGDVDRADRYFEAGTPLETVRTEILDLMFEKQNAARVDGRSIVPVADPSANAGDPYGRQKKLAAAGAFRN